MTLGIQPRILFARSMLTATPLKSLGRGGCFETLSGPKILVRFSTMVLMVMNSEPAKLNIIAFILSRLFVRLIN